MQIRWNFNKSKRNCIVVLEVAWNSGIEKWQANKRASKQCKSQPNSTPHNVCRLKFIVYAMHTHKIHYTRNTIVSVSCCVYFCSLHLYVQRWAFFTQSCAFHFLHLRFQPFCQRPHCPISLPPCSIGVYVGWRCCVWCHANKAIKIEYPEWIKKEDSRSRAFVFRWDLHTAPFTCHKNELH